VQLAAASGQPGPGHKGTEQAPTSSPLGQGALHAPFVQICPSEHSLEEVQQPAALAQPEAATSATPELLAALSVALSRPTTSFGSKSSSVNVQAIESKPAQDRPRTSRA
jgi:hypothetical protein